MRTTIAALGLLVLSAVSAQAAGDTTAQTPAVPAPAPAIAPEPAAAPDAIRKIDAASFLRQVMVMNDREAATARLAIDRSSNDAVKAFARRLIADHEEMAARLGEVAAAGARAPDATGAVETPTDREEAKTQSDLDKAEGADFDRLFLESQAAAHTDAMRLFTAYAETGDDPALKDFAVAGLATLQEHQQVVAELQKSN